MDVAPNPEQSKITMAGTAYYNENDPFAAAWLRNLIAAGLIAPGVVDERSIVDVQPVELNEFVQVHLFAGIGRWSYALRLAGWPDDRPVWTGSCPCQPFSAAGKQKGTSDARHLWPEFHRLIAERLPATVFGEQVASRLGRGWLAGVRADLEALGYAVGAADIGAAGVGAPHIRQRLWWVAYAMPNGLQRSKSVESSGVRRRSSGQSPATGGVGHSPNDRRHQEREVSGRGFEGSDPQGREQRPWDDSIARGMGDPDPTRSQGRSERSVQHADQRSPWAASTLIPCADGKVRRSPAEPALQPLAHGIPNRMGLLRGSGNAIVPQVAAEFVRAFLS